VTCPLLVYADDVNLLGDNIEAVKRNTETLINARKKVGLEVNVEKNKYMLVSCNQNADQRGNIRIGNRSFENVSHFKYLGKTSTNQNLILEEIRMRLNSGKGCYNAGQNLPSSRLMSENIKSKIYDNTNIWPVVLYGCETRPLILREEHRLRVSENMVLRGVFGTNRN
jgi:hypothetical protein